ncbi:MAG: iron chelate uptake ABC transporter family permease subunit [Anaerotignaceae bacterium]
MTKTQINNRKLLFMIAIVALGAVAFLFANMNYKIFDYAMSIRVPKLVVMSLAAFCIGSASVVFQSLINNTIVTPCLLGMNSLYILIHTLVVFIFGSTSVLVTVKSISFGIDLFIMAFAAILIYGMLFRKTKGNVLYIILAGSVMATLFTSITSTLHRVMDPNEFDTLQNALISSFHKVNAEIVVFAVVVIIAIIVLLWKDIKLLDVITLGKDQAINLGVDYEKTMSRLLLGVTLFIAVATALVGPISFLGLIIANLARQLFKTYRHTYLIFGTILFGMITLFIGQTIIERVFSFSANISAFINITGGIYFLFLLLRQGDKA